MYYTIYKITNTINGKFYIGSHRTKNLDDNYMGSGKMLKRAFKKYGIEKFTKDILFVFDTPEEMYAKEAEIVNDDFLLEENTYNIMLGGHGGFDYLNTNPSLMTTKRLDALKIGRAIARDCWKDKFENNKNFREIIYKNCKIASKKSQENNPNGTFYGKNHSNETKEKISNKAKIHSKGSKNSQYGTCWITNGKENKKIKKENIDVWIPLGYYKGRKIKEQNND